MTLIDATKLSPSVHGSPEHVLIVSYSEKGRQLPEMLREQPLSTTYTEVVGNAQRAIEMDRSSLILLYLEQEAVGPLQIIRSAVEHGANVIVIGPGSPEKLPRQCLSHGASQYLSLPVSRERLCQALGILPLKKRSDGQGAGGDNAHFERELGMLYTSTSKMQQVVTEVKRVAPTSATVFLRGESGTGKEVVAQAIHQLSKRCNKPFVPRRSKAGSGLIRYTPVPPS